MRAIFEIVRLCPGTQWHTTEFPKRFTKGVAITNGDTFWRFFLLLSVQSHVWSLKPIIWLVQPYFCKTLLAIVGKNWQTAKICGDSLWLKISILDGEINLNLGITTGSYHETYIKTMFFVGTIIKNAFIENTHKRIPASIWFLIIRWYHILVLPNKNLVLNIHLFDSLFEFFLHIYMCFFQTKENQSLAKLGHKQQKLPRRQKNNNNVLYKIWSYNPSNEHSNDISLSSDSEENKEYEYMI